MTKMRIISVAIPDDLDKLILEKRKQDEYVRLTYSEVVRRLLYMAVGEHDTAEDSPGQSA